MFFKQFQYMTETVLIPKRAFRDRFMLSIAVQRACTF